MELSKYPEDDPRQDESTSEREGLAGSVSLFLRLWTYGSPSTPPSGLLLEQDSEITEFIDRIIRESEGVVAQCRPELLSVRFDSALQAVSAAKALQRRFLTFHRNSEPQQVVPSILIYSRMRERLAGTDSPAPEDMLANITSAQILVSNSIFELVKSIPGFEFNPKPVREAGETFGPEAIYELLWTDESTYGHLRQSSRNHLDKVGRYRIQEELGRGAMGAVYKAYDELIGRTVALKTILIDRNTPDRDELIDRLKQEAKAAGGLDHPNIITIYDVGQEDDVLYLSMQLVEGKTLSSLLLEGKVPTLPDLISWADQISSAVGFAHARGVIHRDLKPANLMLTKQGVIKVLDFGIAKIEDSSLTQTGSVVGTPSYMSPEQVEGKRVDHRADIFSLGSVLYELVTKEKPFRGDIATILYKIANEDPIAPSLINPAIPGAIDGIIRKALAKDPGERFQSCEEMRKAFLEQARLLGIKAETSTPLDIDAKLRPRPPATFTPYLLDAAPRWNRPGATTGVCLALAMIATASWAVYNRPEAAFLKSEVKALLAAIHSKEPRSESVIVKRDDPGAQRSHTAGIEVPTPSIGVNTAASSGTNAVTQIGTLTNAKVTQSPTASGFTSTQQPTDAKPVSGIQSSDSASLPAVITAQSATVPAPAAQESSAPPQSVTVPSAATVQQSDQRQSSGESIIDANSIGTDVHPAKLPFGIDENQTTAPNATQKPLKTAPREPMASVDGFTRRDIPELLREADVAAKRGDSVLARYSYNLILKLDPSNVSARSGLQRLQAAQ